MKKFELIKRMNVKELTGVFFSFLLPFIPGKENKAVQDEVWNKIEEFLMSEVNENGTERSQKQS